MSIDKRRHGRWSWGQVVLAIAMMGGLVRAADPVQVVATTTMVADLVRRVGGERVAVTGLMGPGVDPHLYKPTAQDVQVLGRAELVFYNGLLLEGRMADLFTRMSRRGKPVYAVTESVPEAELLEPPDLEGHFDPHVWGDPRLWAATVETVVTALAGQDPSGAAGYRERGAALQAEYRALWAWGRRQVAAVPEAGRILITSHDAFNYLGRAFGFQVVGVQGISTVSEAGLADITRIADFIKQRRVKAIFVESSVSPATIERISTDAGVAIGGELFSDALGTPGEWETVGEDRYDLGTYEGWLKHNLNTVVKALQ